MAKKIVRKEIYLQVSPGLNYSTSYKAKQNRPKSMGYHCITDS